MSAGLAIYYGVLIYAEISGDDTHEIINSEIINLPNNCVERGKIDVAKLEKAFVKLKAKNPKPMTLGIPEALITQLNFPEDMKAKDVKSALNFKFNEYFGNVKIEDSVFDVIKIVSPNRNIFFAAAVNSLAVAEILNAAKNAGLKILAVEPIDIALARVLPVSNKGFFMAVTKNAVVAVFNGKIFFLRVVAHELSDFEAQAIAKIVESKMPKTEIQGIMKINSENYLKLSQGLAMRDFSNTTMNLIPVQLENIEIPENSNNRDSSLLALKILTGAFLLLAIFTSGMAFMNINSAKVQVNTLNSFIAGAEMRRDKLLDSNAELENTASKIESTLNFMAGEIPVHEVLEILESNAGAGINFTSIKFYRDDNQNFALISAETSSDENLVAMTSGLNDSDLISNVIISHSDKNKDGLIKFNMTLKIKDIYPKNENS